MAPMRIETLKFQMSQGRMASRLVAAYGRPWIIGLASLLLAAAIASAASWMFAVAGLMLALVVAPGVMAVLYFAYALKPATALNVLPHKLIFTDSEIEVLIDPMAPLEGEEPSGPKRVAFAMRDIKETAAYRDGISISLGSKGFLWAPYYSFEGPGALREVTSFLRGAQSSPSVERSSATAAAGSEG